MVREFKSRRPHQKHSRTHGGFGGLCREDQLLLRFFGEGLRQVKLNRASLAKWGAESAGRRSSIWRSSECRSTCKVRDLKSPAPIPASSMIRACSASRKQSAKS